MVEVFSEGPRMNRPVIYRAQDEERSDRTENGDDVGKEQIEGSHHNALQ